MDGNCANSRGMHFGIGDAAKLLRGQGPQFNAIARFWGSSHGQKLMHRADQIAVAVGFREKHAAIR